MAKHTTVNEFYSSLLANHAVRLDARWQHHIASYANQHRKYNLLAGLLKRPDVEGDIVAGLEGHTAAAVKGAWLARHVDDIDVLTAAVADETRPAVLAVVVTEEQLPVEVFNRIVADAANIDLVLAALSTGRASAEDVYTMLGRVADSSKLDSNGAKKTLTAAVEQYPLTYDTLLGASSNIKVVTAALTYATEATDTERAAAVERALRAALDTDEQLDHRSIASIIRLFAAAGATIGPTPELLHITSVYVPQIIVAAGAWLQPGAWQRTQLENLNDHIFDTYDELSLELDGTDDTARAALAAATRMHAQPQANGRRAWGMAPGHRRLCTRIICDTSYSEDVRYEAVRQMAASPDGSVNVALLKTLHHRRVPLSVRMASELHSRMTNYGLEILCGLVPDSDELIDELIERRGSVGLVTQLDALGLLDDDRVAALAERIPVSWFAELPTEHPAIAKIVETGLAVTVDELGSDGVGWEFFESCYGNVAANPALLARLAATAE